LSDCEMHSASAVGKEGTLHEYPGTGLYLAAVLLQKI